MLKTIVFILLSASLPATAHEGEDHGHDKPAPVVTNGRNSFTTEVSSDKYELLLRYETILPGEDAILTLFVSDYATNRPVDKAAIKLVCREDKNIPIRIQPAGEGTYKINMPFPKKGTYSLSANIDSRLGPDLLLLSDIVTNRTAEIPHNAEDGPQTRWFLLMIIIGSLLTGLLAGIWLKGRNLNRGAKTVIMLTALGIGASPVNLTHAHEDHDQAAIRSNSLFTTAFYIPKETQFLFDVFTQKLSDSHFDESTSLFGTILPSSGGQAKVTAPSEGKIISVAVKVGEQVKEGQLLATFEQNMDPASRVELLSRKNDIEAELAAAQKQYDRLISIRDIAAKKDLDEAEARLQKAKENARLLKGGSGRIVNLTSPVSGTVGNFVLTGGSTASSGQLLFTITDLNKLFVEAQVFDKDAVKVSQGKSFSVECSNDEHKSSLVKLVSLGQETNPSNQSQRVLFELSNPDHQFRIGEFVNIRVSTAADGHGISVPNSAISEINGKPVVFSKRSAESFEIIYVQTGNNNGSFTEITKGLFAGDRIVTNGTYQVKMIYLNQ